MKAQKCRRLECERQPRTSLRPNPKRAESSDQAIQDAEIRRTSPRAIKNQQLMFGENGLRALRLVERYAKLWSRRGQEGKSDRADQILTALKNLDFQRNLEFARDRFRTVRLG